MNQLDPALLINLLGFGLGVSLYAMLFVMVFRHRSGTGSVSTLLLLTACLGLVWNVSELVAFAWRDFYGVSISPYLQAASLSALGFLPAAVIHTVKRNDGLPTAFVVSAYSLSVFAAILHFNSAAVYAVSPSILAFQVLSAGSLILAAGLFLLRAWEGIENRAILVTALLVFAFSALHLSTDSEYRWWPIELVAHQSSLPLVIAILIQDYRFAFADLYLKRALSLLLIALTVFATYVLILGPFVSLRSYQDANDPIAIGVTLLTWIATACFYPFVQRFSNWLVDRIILKRQDYEAFLHSALSEMETHHDEAAVLKKTVAGLNSLFSTKCELVALPSAREAEVNGLVEYSPEQALIRIETDLGPDYSIEIHSFPGGRRLLSDEAAMLEKLSLGVGRRIDSIRVEKERQEREARERELARLTAEARLSALRSQINPHFLFNALTTIGHLIRVAPDRAFATLMKLTTLLRSVLRNKDEFTPLGDELALVRNYLDIEKARFENRLQVEFDVPETLETVRIPSLIIQPLVENSVKHAIAKNGAGGTVKVHAEDADGRLLVEVSDTGSGGRGAEDELVEGIGLSNVRERLVNHFGDEASLQVTFRTGGSVVRIEMPIESPGTETGSRERKKGAEIGL